MDTVFEFGVDRYKTCHAMFMVERRNKKSNFDAQADVDDRFFKSLPLRRRGDRTKAANPRIGSYNSKAWGAENIKKQLRGEESVDF